ncbi:hypothetical protein D3C84_1126590 [compost metagenome]
MAWADAQGLAAIRERLLHLSEHCGSHWQPAGLIDRLVADGKRFADVKEGKV